MTLSKLCILASVSALAMSSSLAAQEEQVLEPVSLISEGQENVRASGGAVVSREDLELLKPTDVSQLFARESAVTVSGGAGPSKRIHVFGMEQSQLNVKVDGVPQAANSWHHTGSNVIDPVFLKRVEVEAGAAAADAGFAAAAGAVRYETVSALDLLADGRSTGGRAGLSYGSNGRGGAANLALFGRHNNFDWFVMGHGTSGNRNYKDGEGREVLGTAPGSRGLLAKFGYETANERIELAYENTKDSADRLIKMNLDQASDTVLYPLTVSRETLSVGYKSLNPTALWDPELKLYVSDNGYWRNNYAPSRTNGNMILDERQTGLSAKNIFTLGQGSLTVGLDHNHHKYQLDNYGVRQPRYRKFSTTQTGLFAQGRFAFANGIDVSAGGRIDNHQLDDWNGMAHKDTGVSGNATVSYQITDGAEVFAAASSTYTGHVIGDYAYLHARGPGFAVSPDYATGRAKNIKAGVNLSGNNWTAGFTLFDTRISGLPTYVDPYLSNLEQMRSRGITLNASYAFGETRIGASLTHAKTSSKSTPDLAPEGAAFMPVGDTAALWVDHAMPAHNLKLGVSLAVAGSIDPVTVSGVSFMKQAGYGVVNTYAEWTPPSLGGASLRLGVDNLFDKNYYDRASYGSGPRATPIYSPGRTVTLAANFAF